MVYNNEVLFIHLGKTGGMSVTNYLCNVLKPPVIHVISEEVTESTKQAGYEIHHSWKRHANLVEASSYFKKIGIKLSDFKLIICVVRNPIDLDFSYYKHLRTKRYREALFANDNNLLLYKVSKADYKTFALHHFTHYHGKLKDFFEIDGIIPDNLRVVKFENLVNVIPELVKPFSVKEFPFPHSNKSTEEKKQKTELNAAEFNSIYKKYDYLFDKFYSSDAPKNIVKQSNAPETHDKIILIVAGNDKSGVAKVNTVIDSHSKIILKRNRYDKLMSAEPFGLKPEHFTKNRFLKIQKGNANDADSGQLKKANKALTKWDQAELIGISIEHSREAFNYLKTNFNNFQYLFIFRNIISVVKIIKTNLLSQDKTWNRDVLAKAVNVWNQSIKSGLEISQGEENFICINFDNFIDSNQSITPILNPLNLSLERDVLRILNKTRFVVKEKTAKLTPLTAEETEYINTNALYHIFEILNQKHNVLSSKEERTGKLSLSLHIGTEKTGSTSIQEFLQVNRKKLKKQGIAFLQSIGDRNHKQLAMAHVSEHKPIESVENFNTKFSQERRAWKKKLLEDFKKEVTHLDKGIKKVIISSEHFSSLLESIEEIESLYNLFSDYFSSIYINVYLRRQDFIAVSRRSTAYLSGYPSRKSDFEELEPIPFYNYYNLLNIWEKAMPKALIIPRVFDKSEFIDNNLISDFAMTSGINLSSDFKLPKILNVSLSKSAMDAALFFDFIVEQGVIDIKDEGIEAFRLRMLEKINCKFPGSGKKPSQVVARDFLLHYKDINNKTAKKWFSKNKLFSMDFSMYPEEPDNSTVNIEVVQDVILMLTEETKFASNIRKKMMPVLTKVGRFSLINRFIEKDDSG
ncbi:hypothetical protein [Lentimicrobium sp. S6]|uniref:hypothetical protein n=1 Tax=Lentimicrobium sp. S6 TaxID=2735872 RepID=UPI00155438B4|nr:hypothetical protein [Lentimicrobium sp. S6]NPD47856.1 hypothetical protein [Lentimicrobium sp. S6]